MKIKTLLTSLTEQDFIIFIFLYLLSIIVRYFTSEGLFFTLQILLLLWFLISKRNTFWLAFMFIIDSSPGGIFSMQDGAHLFSLYNGPGVGNLYFWMPFLLVALIKSYRVKANYPKYFLYNLFIILVIYFAILLALNGIYKISAVVRMTSTWVLFFLLPRMLKADEHYEKFFNIIFALVPFVILTQLYRLVTTQEIAALIGGMGNPNIASPKDVYEADQALRPAEGIFIPFLALLGAGFFITMGKKSHFKPNYLNLILTLSILSIFLTATRSWLFAAIFFAMAVLIINSKKIITSLLSYSLPVIAVILLVVFVPSLNRQMELALERYETVGDFLKGDITAKGTAQRFDVRAPRVMAKYFESPYVGWGYGIDAAKYSDGHVGHQNLLLHTGIVGYTLFCIVWLAFITKMLTAKKRLKRDSIDNKIPLILIVFFLAIHIINISVQWFNYLLTFNTAFILAILLSLANKIYWHSKLEAKSDKIELKREEQRFLYESTATLSI